MGRRRQHSKGKARPRAWHHGRHQGRVDDRALAEADPVFERADQAEREAAERAAVAHRDRAEHKALLEQIDRVSPHVPVWWP